MRKKITIAVIITVLLIDMLIPNFIFAVGEEGVGTFEDVSKHPIGIEGISEEGKARVQPDDKPARLEEITETKTIGNMTLSAVSWLIIIPGKAINTVLATFIATFQDKGPDAQEVGLTHPFTIENLVMGEYTIFNIDIFDTEDHSTSTMGEIKENIAIWYTILRNIALAIGLLVLVYIGIRMAISTVASDQAKYKKMLMSWITSMIILFTMHYIAIFFIGIQEQLLGLIKPPTEGVGFEEEVIVKTWESLVEAEGFNKAQYIIIYYVLLYYQLKFVFLYFKRFLSVGFLITIAPLVTITYSIDKAGDNKAQAFATWLKELLINIFIQVLHAIIYVVFIFSAAEIAKKVPFLGIVFLMGLSRTEKLVRRTFSVRGEGISDVNVLDKLKK